MKDHTECIQIQYDPNIISFDALLDIMFAEHRGYLNKPYSIQYRSGIWYQTEEQEKCARGKIDEIRQATSREVFTHVAPLGEFYMAEEYHQKYMEKAKTRSVWF
mmetsp:Transcript_24927/g.44325  ORF Transcript_24927/g.44325 Transcript_24927/m.44325 type:complete len:104 (-) Transcript_24927:103-414(-)